MSINLAAIKEGTSIIPNEDSKEYDFSSDILLTREVDKYFDDDESVGFRIVRGDVYELGPSGNDYGEGDIIYMGVEDIKEVL